MGRALVRDEDTIFALSSGSGKAGVAVVRLSGGGCARALRHLAGPLPDPRRASLRALRDGQNGEALDRGLVLWFPGPASYTGEDMAELHVHGGRACVAGVLGALGHLDGLRAAEAGEFTRRAFHNARLDLTQVEGLADLIEAETQAQRRLALRQMSGADGQRFDAWREDLLGCLAHLEAAIDFADEAAVPGDLGRGVRARVAALKADMERQVAAPRAAEMVRDGLRVVIAGAPNVGKSSLLNALARRDAAIVSEQPGTTRDVVEVHLDLGGYAVILADTAGLRDSADAIERQGVDRARQRIDEADLVLEVRDASVAAAPPFDDAIDSRTIRLWNKVDIASAAAPGAGEDLRVSAKTGAGLDGLIAVLADRAEALLCGAESVLVTRQRHRAALTACIGCLDRALATPDADVELTAEDLRLAAGHLGRVTGRIGVEDLLDVIFADFCIGK